MWVIVGALPEAGYPLTFSQCRITRDHVIFDNNHKVPIQRGTAALITSMCIACSVLEIEMPYALVAGDIGKGDGSKAIYKELSRIIPSLAPAGMTFQYLLPDAYWHDHILWAIEGLPVRPTLVADAGYMYAAKMCGACMFYDLVTPDVGELAFLADADAHHPFYVHGALLEDESKSEVLADSAYSFGNTADCMLVKGRKDIIIQEGVLVHSVEEPLVEAMEFIGGTGDTVTGIASALLAAGCTLTSASHIASLANRYMGKLANPTPATQISELLPFLPEALEIALNLVPIQKKF